MTFNSTDQSYLVKQQHNIFMVLFAPHMEQVKSEYQQYHLQSFSSSEELSLTFGEKQIQEISTLISIGDSVDSSSSIGSTWSSEQSSLSSVSETSPAIGQIKYGERGCSPRYTPMEENLKNWVLDRISKGIKVNKNMLRMQAMKMADSDQFRGSRGWLRCFLRRYPAIQKQIQKQRKLVKQQKQI